MLVELVGMCVLVLLCVYGEVVWQCFLTVGIVLFHIIISPYIWMLVVVTLLLQALVSMWMYATTRGKKQFTNSLCKD